MWVMHVWDSHCLCCCYWRMLINFYIACTTIFQPVAAKWQLRVSPCYRFFFSSYVSYARLRLSVFVVCYCRILINFYIACTTIFQPVSARWQLSPRFFACFVSDAWLRLCLFFFLYWYMHVYYILYCMSCYFSASPSHPPILMTLLILILLKTQSESWLCASFFK